MSLLLYNTLTRRKETFEPLEEGQVRMYTCGPTVYDYFHIGNARSFVVADVIRRYLEFAGYNVTFVMNITDIDDKIINRAAERGVDASKIAGEFTEAFFQDIEALGVRPADVYPKATETIEDIVRHVEGLVKSGAAYVVDGDVYFNVEAFPEYGKLSGKKLEELVAGARVEKDERKRNPADFALWKAAKPGEPSWESPWGLGRPGWHIECSVMSQKYLGETFDIHAGGNDLIFPHHENEIAQSEALTGKQFVRYWLHFGFLRINEEKMSKSLGNFITAREALKKWPAYGIRFFFLQTHYRSPLNLLPEGIEGAVKGAAKFRAFRDELDAMGDGARSFDVKPYRERFVRAMNDDFNTPAALGALFDLMRDVRAAADGIDRPSIDTVRDFFDRAVDGVFGILPPPREALSGADDALVGDLVRILIDVRNELRKERNFALADRIRDTLAAAGVTLNDGKDGTSWSYSPPESTTRG